MTETLYSEVHNVRYKCQDTEDRQVAVKVTVEIQTTTSPLHRKDLLVRLTDDKDPFFLYNLCLGEEDYQSLKTQQGLLIDFSAFPQRFIALLQQCLSEEKREYPKFLLQFEVSGLVQSAFGTSSHGSGQLGVIETNPFKHLTHLLLQFIPGNDSDVKKYLATCLKKTMEQRDKLESKLSSMERELGQKLEGMQKELTEKNTALNKLRSEATGQTEKLSTRHAKDINSEREKALKIQTEMQQRHEREKKEIESSYQKTNQQLEKRIADIENINKELTDRKYRAESTIREQKARLSGLEEELKRCRTDLQQSRRESSSLDAERHNQDKNLQQLKTKVAVTEQELLDKEQLVAQMASSLEATQGQKFQHEQRISEQQSQIRKLENTIKTMSEELLKGNEIIKRLQGELRGYIGKVKLRNEVTTRQEKVIGEKEQKLDKVQLDLESTTEKFKIKEEEVIKLKEQLQSTIEKLEECQGLLKTNENVINWLNKQLNERQISSSKSVPPASMGSQNNYTNSNIDHNSITAFKQVRSLPQPNYSTPIGSMPQTLHLSEQNITSGFGASPHIFPPTRQQIGSTSSYPASLMSKPSNMLKVHYNPTNGGLPPGNKENLSPGNKNSGIDPIYLTSSATLTTKDHSPKASDTEGIVRSKYTASLPQTNRLSQQTLHQATFPPTRVGQNHKSSRPTVPRPIHVSQPKVVSAYFTGTVPKSQTT